MLSALDNNSIKKRLTLFFQFATGTVIVKLNHIITCFPAAAPSSIDTKPPTVSSSEITEETIKVEPTIKAENECVKAQVK